MDSYTIKIEKLKEMRALSISIKDKVMELTREAAGVDLTVRLGTVGATLIDDVEFYVRELNSLISRL